MDQDDEAKDVRQDEQGASRQDTRDLLESYPWAEEVPRLTVYSNRELQRLRWYGIRGGSPPGGVEARDIVSEAITHLFSGRRAWDSARHPDLRRHLLDIIDSKISALVSRSENQGRLEANMVTTDDEGREVPALSAVASTDRNPLEQALHSEREKLSNDFFWAFYDTLTDDPQLQQALGCLFDDISKPQAIANHMGIAVADVYNIRKRLRRRLEAFRNERAGRRS